MPYTTTLTANINIDGKTFPSVVSLVTEGVIKKEISIQAGTAKTGTLSTRTDDDTGEVTLSGGHGITTGALVDVYWSGGSRYGITAGTVAGNVVPIDGGHGDNLPVQSTDVTVMVPIEEPFVVEGDDVEAIGTYANTLGTIAFAKDDDSIIFAVRAGGATNTNQSYQWAAPLGVTNPLAGESVAKVFFSHGSTIGPFTMGVAVACD